ncbi:hypothetical protein K1719_034384 [Acacia pycnantha]|nr:hypothetical protein K1719_034384 [Acacia pycnantha]
MYSSRGGSGYGQSYAGQSAYGQNMGSGYSGGTVGGPDVGRHSVASRHSAILGTSQEVDVSGYQAHSSTAAQYGGQYSSVYGSAALSSAQQVGKWNEEADFRANPSPVEQLPLERAKPPSKRAVINLGEQTHEFRKSVDHFGFLVEIGMRRWISVKIRALWVNCPLKAKNRPQNEPRAIWGQKCMNLGKASTILDSLSKVESGGGFQWKPDSVEQLPLESAIPPSKRARSNLGRKRKNFGKASTILDSLRKMESGGGFQWKPETYGAIAP